MPDFQQYRIQNLAHNSIEEHVVFGDGRSRRTVPPVAIFLKDALIFSAELSKL